MPGTLESPTAPTVLGRLIQGLGAHFDTPKGRAEGARSIMEAFQPAWEELAPYAQFSNDRYQRNLIHREANFELLLLCWQPGQCSPVHDHRFSWCGVRVIQGAATEVRFEKTDCGTWIPSGNQTARVGQLVCSFDTDTHIIANFGDANLITLHCYAPPLRNYEIVPNERTLGANLNRVYNSMQNDAGTGTIL